MLIVHGIGGAKLGDFFLEKDCIVSNYIVMESGGLSL